jgi:hypothetical protein
MPSDLERLVMMEPGCEPREPTAADLVAFLQARPDLAVELPRKLRRLRVAGPWERRNCGSIAREAVFGWEAAYVWASGEDHAWSAPALGFTDGPRGHERTEAEAMAAADAALVAAGWALAGGGRGCG